MGKLDGRVALITAGGSGLGKYISKAFIEEGCAVAIASRDLAKLEAAVKEFEAMGGTAFAVKCDISKEDEVVNMVDETINRFGKIDILVNNTGTPGPICNVVDMDVQKWKDTIDVDLTGTMLVSKEVLKHMIARGNGGSIIMVNAEAATIAEGWGGYPLRASYMSVKNGMRGLQAAMAVENGKYGIRVNAIKPAAIESDRMMRIMQGYADSKGTTLEEEVELEKSHYSMKRITKPEEVAACALFLATDDSIAVTNQVLTCSSGLSLKAAEVK